MEMRMACERHRELLAKVLTKRDVGNSKVFNSKFQNRPKKFFKDRPTWNLGNTHSTEFELK